MAFTRQPERQLHGKADPAPLAGAIAALRRHIYLEEEFLFPPLKTAGLMIQIFAMLRQHGDLWKAMPPDRWAMKSAVSGISWRSPRAPDTEITSGR